MQELLFGTEEFYADPYYDPNSSYFSSRVPGYPTSQVAETVFKDIADQKPMTLEQVAEELGDGWLEGSPDYESFKDDTKEHNIDWEAYQKASKKFQVETAGELIAEADGKELYLVEYSDDSQYGCALEHGPVFDKIDAFRLSKH